MNTREGEDSLSVSLIYLKYKMIQNEGVGMLKGKKRGRTTLNPELVTGEVEAELCIFLLVWWWLLLLLFLDAWNRYRIKTSIIVFKTVFVSK